MEKKSILIAVNHFEYSNGVASALRNMLMNIDYNKYDITLLPLYRFDPEFALPISEKIKFIKGFGRYFRGLDKIISLIPLKILYKLFVRKKYDIEIAYQYGLPTKILSVSDNNKKICWIHTYDEGLTLRNYYLKYKKLITVAAVGREKLIRDGMEPDKCDFCYNVIDELPILERADENIDVERTHKFVAVTVARMDPDKAFGRLFRCIDEIKEKIPDVEFWIVGGGSEESELRAYVDANKLNDVIKIIGAQTNPFKYMSKADVYLCASLREGFSTSCQEAAILGKPVISVNVDGAPELIQIAGTGLVIGNTENDIKECLISAFNSPELIENWKEIASKNRYNFYKQGRINRLENIISNL